jgi:FkbM family methyltransferase
MRRRLLAILSFARAALRNAKRFLASRRAFRRLKWQNLEKIRFGSELIYVRPGSPDIEVARSCLNGEFESVIDAAKPLRFEFIVDAGGYIGTAAIVLAKAFPSATVVTLEPSIENFAVLQRNVSPFANIVAINKALHSRHCQMRLFDRWTGPWGVSMYETADANCPDPVFHHVTETLTISSLLTQFGKVGIDILKLDIEGAEIEVFESSASWIGRTRVMSVELHERFRSGCESAFEEATRGRSNSVGCGEKILSVDHSL